MHGHRAALGGVRYCEVLNCTEPVQGFSRCRRHSDVRDSSNGLFNNNSPRTPFGSAYDTNGVARPTAKRTAAPRFSLKSHPAPSTGSSAPPQRPRHQGLSAPAVAYPLGRTNNVPTPESHSHSPASSLMTPNSQTVGPGRTHRASLHDSERSVSRSGLRAPLMQPSPSWNGSSHSDATTSSGTEERRLQHATSYRSPAQQEPTPRERWTRLRPEPTPTALKSIPNLTPTAFLGRAIGASNNYLTKSHVTNGSGDLSSNNLSFHRPNPPQNPRALTLTQHPLQERRQLDIRQHEQQVLEQRMREQQLRERQFREQQRQQEREQQRRQEQQRSQALQEQQREEQRLREQELQEQQNQLRREWVEKQAERQQKEWQRIQQDKEKLHRQTPMSLQEPVPSDNGSRSLSVSTPSVEPIVVEEKRHPEVNSNGKRPAPVDDGPVSNGVPESPVLEGATQARPQSTNTFDSDAFDAMIHRTADESNLRQDERDLVMWLPLNPAIHRLHNHSDAWHKAKAEEIKNRPRRKAWFGKVGARIHWLMEQQRRRSKAYEAARQSGTTPPRTDPKPVGFSRPADFGLVERKDLPEDVQANAAWLAAWKWHRQSRNERDGTQNETQDASTLTWNMYKQLVEEEEASTWQ